LQDPAEERTSSRFSLNEGGEEANGREYLVGPSLRNSKRRVEKPELGHDAV
jgi:hypothetical protein